MIELTAVDSNSIFVNPNRVAFLVNREPAGSGTCVWFSGTEGDYIIVKEDIALVSTLIMVPK